MVVAEYLTMKGTVEMFDNSTGYFRSLQLLNAETNEKDNVSNSVAAAENRTKALCSTIHDHMVSAEITIDEPQNTEVSNTKV
jgi:hypothetical protein